jgi:hypothetical protein
MPKEMNLESIRKGNETAEQSDWEDVLENRCERGGTVNEQ